MKYVWPPITSALEKRKKTIADGLAAAEKGQQSLENAKVEIDKLLLGGKDEAKNIISMAEKRADDIVDEANQKAAQESLNKIKIAEQNGGQAEQAQNGCRRAPGAGLKRLHGCCAAPRGRGCCW